MKKHFCDFCGKKIDRWFEVGTKYIDADFGDSPVSSTLSMLEFCSIKCLRDWAQRQLRKVVKNTTIEEGKETIVYTDIDGKSVPPREVEEIDGVYFRKE